MPAGTDPPAADMGGSRRVTILLALCRSRRFLDEQLASFAAQSHDDWDLIVSDDDPVPEAGAALDAFAAACPGHAILRRRGPGRGFAANFLSLLAAVPPGTGYAALSDHDDVWFPDKLARALAALDAVPAGQAGLYCARTEICDESLVPLGLSPRFRRPPAFGNALVQSIGGGNTMVLNRAALDLVRAAAAEAGGIVAHDWWLYQIVTGCGGRVIRDELPVLSYRQHGGNAIGANRALAARLRRIGGILGGRFRRWNAINLAALNRSAHRFTPEARAALAAFARARQGPWRGRLRALRASGAHRQGRGGDLALVLACLLGRL